MINAKTRLCALIGDPVEHSRSPLIQNAAFAACGLDYIYVAFRVKAEDLGTAISGMRSLDFAGFNVTIPHKVAVISCLDQVDPLAEMIGSVNTVVNDHGKLTGYNTDAPGFLEPLTQRGIELEGRNVLLLGAGGAARAVAFMLANEGANLTILNRTRSRAQELAARIKESLHKEITCGDMSPDSMRRSVENSEMIVNTTSVGMSPHIDETPIPSEMLRPGLVVYDIIYTPSETRLLREAKEKRATTLNGVEMLAWQGALAFEKWTGYKAPIDVMLSKMKEALGSGED